MLFRQGDVPLYSISQIPEGLKPIPKVSGSTVLAFGEFTGHTHRIVEDNVELFGDRELSYLFIPMGNVTSFSPESYEFSEKLVNGQRTKTGLRVTSGAIIYRRPLSEMEDIESAIKSASVLTYPGSAIIHEEHDAIIIPPGSYTNTGQYQYRVKDMPALRVAD